MKTFLTAIAGAILGMILTMIVLATLNGGTLAFASQASHNQLVVKTEVLDMIVSDIHGIERTVYFDEETNARTVFYQRTK